MEPSGFVVFAIQISIHHFLFHNIIHMNVLSIVKWKGLHDAPAFKRVDKAEDIMDFTKDSINFNTFVRAFAHNPLQWRYIELKLCDWFNVENWNVRVADAYYSEVKTDRWYKSVVNEIWKVAMEIAEEIHII